MESNKFFVCVGMKVEEKIFSILSHKIRRNILRIIYEKNGASYRDLTALNLEPGTLYFHIKSLTSPLQFIYQDKKTKKYYLTELGYEAYEIINNINSLAYIGRAHSISKNILAKIFNILALTRTIKAYTRGKLTIIHILQAIVIVFVIGVLSTNLQIYPILFILEPPTAFFPLRKGLFITTISWLSVALITEGILRFCLKNKQETIKLLLTTHITYMPILIVTSIVYLINTVTPVTEYIHDIYILPISIFLEIWCLLILAGVIAYVKKVSYQTSLVISLTIGYLNLIIVAIQLIYQ